MPGPINITGLPPLAAPSTSTLEERPGARIGAATYGDALRGAPRAPTGVSQSFSTFLEAQLRDVNTLHKEADSAVAAMATGRSHNLHEMMIALDRADVSLRLATKVRNKAVEAYQEIMRMPI